MNLIFLVVGNVEGSFKCGVVKRRARVYSFSVLRDRGVRIIFVRLFLCVLLLSFINADCVCSFRARVQWVTLVNRSFGFRLFKNSSSVGSTFCKIRRFCNAFVAGIVRLIGTLRIRWVSVVVFGDRRSTRKVKWEMVYLLRGRVFRLPRGIAFLKFTQVNKCNASCGSVQVRNIARCVR